MKTALITGITGQDGSYLAELLLEKGYEVHGITRRASISNTARIDHLMGKIRLHDGDLSDSPYGPYAVAKQYGFCMVKECREAYLKLKRCA